ncbi:MAG TPA: helix-turn-helix domain-containing protein [Pyrinomonadaceae bacterium]|jgi:AraC-like DNA-binding protein|nr:helix-turn-helix domain-containing protein [Pyrinomonadaceae bacterium]
MNPSLSPLAIVNLLGVAQAILLAAALLSLSRRDRTANRLLAALVAATALSVTGSVLYATRYILLFPHAAQVFGTCNFAFGPLVLLYVRALTSGGARVGRKTLLHFIPAALCALYYLPLYLQSREGKLEYVSRALQNYPPAEWRLKSLLIFFHVMIYLALSARLIVATSRRERVSGVEGAAGRLTWVRNFVLMVLSIWLVAALRFVFAYDSRPEMMMLLPLCLSLWVYVLGYVALSRPELLAGSDALPTTAQAAPPPAPDLSRAARQDAPAAAKKYARSSLTPEKAERSLKKLLHLMTAERAHRDSELTLQKLAARLSLPANHLSQLINERLGQSFADFVNSHRVREAQRLLTDPSASHLSILGIAEEVGFNSKSTFNQVFKKQTGMTPSEFRKGQPTAGSLAGNPSAVAASRL